MTELSAIRWLPEVEYDRRMDGSQYVIMKRGGCYVGSAVNNVADLAWEDFVVIPAGPLCYERSIHLVKALRETPESHDLLDDRHPRSGDDVDRPVRSSSAPRSSQLINSISI